ncbi:GAF domain-containing protein, partial [bacterium]|nr:GAF domain-containing protein [bacterium]
GPEELRDTIDRALATTGAFVRADRSYLFQFDTDSGTMSNTHEWCADGISPQIQNLQNLSVGLFPWSMQRLVDGPFLDIPLVADLPEEAAADREILLEQGIQSILLMATRSRSGVLSGFMGFDAVREVRPWHPEDVHLLTVLTDLIAAALDHDRLLRRLTESEGRQRATLEALPDMLVVFDDHGHILEFRAPEGLDLPQAVAAPVGLSIWNLLDRADRHRARAAVASLAAGCHFGEFKFALGEAPGRRSFEGRLTRHGGDRYLALIRDVTERHHAEAALRELALELTSAEEGQRRDLAVQLHDGIGQELTAVNLRLQALRQRAGSSDPVLAQAIGILQETMRKTQDLTFDLSPTALYDLGLGPALAGLARRFSSPDGPVIEVEIAGAGSPQRTDVAVLLFRVARELLVNALKHADAGRVTIKLVSQHHHVQLVVADDGRGMPADAARRGLEQAGGGFGLFSIRQRIEPLGGRMEITTGRGTVVEITLPGTAEVPARSRSEKPCES